MAKKIINADAVAKLMASGFSYAVLCLYVSLVNGNAKTVFVDRNNMYDFIRLCQTHPYPVCGGMITNTGQYYYVA